MIFFHFKFIYFPVNLIWKLPTYRYLKELFISVSALFSIPAKSGWANDWETFDEESTYQVKNALSTLPFKRMTNWIWSIELNTNFRLKYQFQLFFTFLQVMDLIFQSKFFASRHVRSAIEVKLNQLQGFSSEAKKMMIDFIFIFYTVLTGPWSGENLTSILVSNRLYSKDKRPGSPLLFWIQSVTKF